MKRVFNRLFSLFLCAVVLFSLIPIQAYAADIAAEGSCGTDASWTLTEDGTLTISGKGQSMTAWARAAT